MREAWIQRQFVTAKPVEAPVSFGRARPPFCLIVDLAGKAFTREWWRGVATLAALIAWTIMLGPGFRPLPAGTPGVETVEEWQATGIGPLGDGSRTGARMAAVAKVETIAEAPQRAFVHVFATVGRDGLARSLTRVGAMTGDALQVETLVRGEGGRVPPGTTVAVVLGRRGHAGLRPIERVELRAGMEVRMEVTRVDGALVLTKQPIAVDRTPVRIRGVAGDGLYWALRAAGASSQTAASYLKALATQIDVGEVAPDDRFDMVLAHIRSADGESRSGALLYAGLERSGQRSLQLVAWNVGGRIIWVDAANAGVVQPASTMMWPVNARITSTFGLRVHPILRFARMHNGIDFGAGTGTPIRAAADGQVTRAGWAGGYGRQVRIAHGDGLATSYSHMSRMVVEPGAFVHQGQLIGYVGSSGLSTGPHLHYEVLKGGRAVNPMSVRFANAPAVDPATSEAIKARLKALLNVGRKA